MSERQGQATPSTRPVRVLIVDDHRLFREGMRAILESEASVEVVGEAESGQEALARADELAPDVVLMDIHMPDMSGVEATRSLTAEHEDIRVIMVTMLEEDASVFAAMRAGARGYILKGAGKREVLRAIAAVAEGEALLGPAVASRLMDFFHSLESQPVEGAAAQLFPELTERELEVLGLLAAGENSTQIAERLSLSPKTVSNHLSHIYGKLQVADRAEAMLKARQAGLGREDSAKS